MRILVAGATGSIGIHVVNTAIAMGHQPVALVRNRRKIKTPGQSQWAYLHYRQTRLV